jgi:copper chaperone CopZ/cytochrome c biogenesis protein CcdA
MKNITLHISGTHCSSCKILVEDILNEQIGIKNTKVDLKNETVSFDTELVDSQKELAELLTEKIKQSGYTLHTEKKLKETKNDGVIWQALPIGLGLLFLFFFLQKSGILNLGIGGTATPVTAFLVGLVASVSSCLAVVGGLILSLSAKLAEDDMKNKKVFVLFHFARLISFGFLGGILGMLGQTIGISFVFSAVLGIVASIVMITLGLNLVGVFEKNKFTLPSNLFNFFRKVEHQTFAPILIGFGTFFLPCGFTQSMQIQALSSGSFLSALQTFKKCLKEYCMLFWR